MTLRNWHEVFFVFSKATLHNFQMLQVCLSLTKEIGKVEHLAGEEEISTSFG